MKKWLKRGLDFLFVVMGSAIAAFAMDLFLIPHQVAPGGASGLALVINSLTGDVLSTGVLILIINIPLFLLGFRVFGWLFTFKSILGTVLYSVMVDLMEPVADSVNKNWFVLEGAPYVDMLLFSIYGGVILGIGFGLVIRSGASTGGSDLAALLLNRVMPFLSTGSWILVFDAVVVILAAVAFHNFVYSLYSILVIWISSMIIDLVVGGINHAKAAYIISDQWETIEEAIMTKLDRGVTALVGRGAYSGQEKNVLFCVVQHAQMAQLKRLVSEIDPSAFIVLSDAREVLGEGFRKED